MEPSVMVRQVADLPNVTRDQTPVFDMTMRNALTTLEYGSLRRVFLTGDGDSYHATMACELAFENISKMPCEPMSAQRFLDYGADWMPVPNPSSTLVVGISASGKTQRVAQSLERANARGALTLALTGTAGSPITTVAQRSAVVAVPNMGPSPGIRTYQATLMGLLLLAIRIGEIKNKYHQDEANAMRSEIAALSDAVAATAKASEQPAREAAAAFKDSPIQVWLGSGPSYGTALFASAKVVEAASVFAVGQDLEEWNHVEKFALPHDVPTFIIAPPGRSYWRAIELARQAHQLGRRVVAVTQDGDTDIAPLADFVFPVMGKVREEFSPLLYHIAANLFASYLAENLGRKLFQADNPVFRAALAAYNAQSQPH